MERRGQFPSRFRIEELLNAVFDDVHSLRRDHECGCGCDECGHDCCDHDHECDCDDCKH